MSETVSWLVELAVRPGALGDFRVLSREMVALARTEDGVIDYQRHVSADGKRVHVFERYRDSAAAAAHLRLFAERYGARFSKLVTRRSFTVYGNPNAELRRLLDGYGAVYLRPFEGFSA